MSNNSYNKPTIPYVNFNTLAKPDLLDNCPYLGTFPVWIAPGDATTLDDPQVIIKNKNLDFQIPHHQKYCLTSNQFKELWNIGLCHDGKFPLLNPFDGRQMCITEENANIELITQLSTLKFHHAHRRRINPS